MNTTRIERIEELRKCATIAKFCGWQIEHFCDRSETPTGMGCAPGVSHTKPTRLPDYTNDANCMHEAERHLIRTNHDAAYHYFQTLRRTLPWDGLHASAKERAEVFIHTLDYFKELEP